MNKKVNNLLFIIFTLIYLEIIFRYIMFNQFVNLYIILLVIPVALFIYLLTNIFSNKVNKILTYIIIINLSLIYVMQLIYYKLSGFIFSFVSLKPRVTLSTFFAFFSSQLIKYSIGLIYLFAPFLLLIAFRKHIFATNRLKLNFIFITIIAMISLEFSTVMLLPKKDSYDEYNLYQKAYSPTLTVNKLGLLTALRLDVTHHLFKTSAKIMANPEFNTADYNILNIDWDWLLATESNSNLKLLHQYFKEVKPTNKNDYTGLFKNKNLILILAESLDFIAIDKTLTPTLYKLAKEGLNFTNFYAPLFPVSSIDSEYMSQTSLLPIANIWSLKEAHTNYLPFALGNQFKNQKYQVTAYHNHDYTNYDRHLSYPNLGYDYYACQQGLDINCAIPASDLAMIKVTALDYIAKKQPFFTYYITTSGYLPYIKTNSVASSNWDKVKTLKYSDPVKSYLAQQIELDKAIAHLLTYLEEADSLKNTVIALTTDHYPYGLTLDQINEKAVPNRITTFERDLAPFIIWHEGIKPDNITKLGSSIDIMPTLANLFGLPYDSRLLMGQDLFSEGEKIVIFSDKSWITEKGIYNATTNKVTGAEITDDYLTLINDIIKQRFDISKLVLDKNYYQAVINK